MRTKRRILPFVALMLIAAAATARVQTPPADSSQQFAVLGDLKLTSGKVIRDCRIGYRTRGT